MGSVLIKGVEISPQPSSELSDRVVGVEVNMLILDRSPKSFDKHVVHPSAFTIHADLNAVGLQDAGEGIACELTALIGVEYLGQLLAFPYGVFQRLACQCPVHRVGDRPTKHIARVPVHHRAQVGMPVRHPNIGDI